ncbi:hypothetical protein ASPZODRAFT_129998 [Penicilliopsis zonata CBS 506.65]|uniref:Uncharacterized protein n=1 Tax=Penicilliopsis zonata CBS 506.65 TaxID=1073090 RepID=A0A1L9SLW1_9EURO|nr:hypothetical protein ASPZODRAFT_129998 [Penicilliopsis zonata CBS 506.65]OJJ48081.1 hypothetical protein ASPZODRAFT_129998 [Penicilliopsis zonata CBS 506.65]
MSPALVVDQPEPHQQLKSLARAFEALLVTVQELNCKEKALQEQLEYAHDEYLKLATQLPGGQDAHTVLVAQKIASRPPAAVDRIESLLKYADVIKSLGSSGHVGDEILDAIQQGLECYNSIMLANDDNLNISSETVAAQASGLERDFTTKGATQGDLRCPFSKPNVQTTENGVSIGEGSAAKSVHSNTCGHEDLDPIKAEKNGRRLSRAEASVRSSSSQCPISRCPIRFLDQHSPEEIAEYVEKHKHEIPRSHTICVKRYQKDSQSMRQLDAKYGSLINMIRGLSEKHQAFLPNGKSNATGTASSLSTDRVGKWAESVSLKSPELETLPTVGEDVDEDPDERKSHFDRPMREIRVGESPSRPWGIPVPFSMETAESAPQSPVAQVSKPIEHTLHNDTPPPPFPPIHDSPAQAPHPGRPAGVCPFGHGRPRPPQEPVIPGPEIMPDHDTKPGVAESPGQDQPQVPKPPLENIEPKLPKPANIVFNGPVFFGYSADQAAMVLRQLSNEHNAK